MQRFTFDSELRSKVAAHLAGFERRPLPDKVLKAASVALVMVPDDEQNCCVILTRRAQGLRAHAGQYALPGGRRDSDETAEQTARRELMEEVGLNLDASAVLGVLDDYVTRSGFVITPIVLWGCAQVLRPNPSEVACVFRVPLSALEAPGVPRITTLAESDRPIISLPLVGTYVHAPTAAILFQMREVAIHGRATRVAHFEQPPFAWR